MTKCPLLCSGTRSREVEKGKRVATLEEEKIVRWAIDDRKIGEKKRKSKRTTGKLKSWSQGNF